MINALYKNKIVYFLFSIAVLGGLVFIASSLYAATQTNTTQVGIECSTGGTQYDCGWDSSNFPSLPPDSTYDQIDISWEVSGSVAPANESTVPTIDARACIGSDCGWFTCSAPSCSESGGYLYQGSFSVTNPPSSDYYIRTWASIIDASVSVGANGVAYYDDGPPSCPSGFTRNDAGECVKDRTDLNVTVACIVSDESNGAPIKGANCSMVGTDKSGTTDDNGYASMFPMTNGTTYTLSVSKSGYDARSVSETMDGYTEIPVALTPIGPSCVADVGTSCNSSANACGRTNPGFVNCDGSCSASAPSDDACAPPPPPPAAKCVDDSLLKTRTSPTWGGSDLPTTLNPGQSISIEMEARNTVSSGTPATWYTNGYRLRDISCLTTDRCGGGIAPNSSNSSYWRGSVPESERFYPEFTLVAPDTPGTYKLEMQMVHNSGWEYNTGADASEQCGGIVPKSDVGFGPVWSHTFTVPNTASMTGELLPDDPACKIAEGEGSCDIWFTWDTQNPEDTSAITTEPNVTVAEGNTGGAFLTIPYSSQTFYLYNNAVLLDQETATASCDDGTSWDGDSCESVVNGGWSEWSECSVSACGQSGTQTRTCTNPTPANGGAPCSGPTSQSCSGGDPVNGGWTGWSDWGECSVTACGQTGTQTKTRTCTNPVPACGGKSCSGASTLTRPCETGDCVGSDSTVDITVGPPSTIFTGDSTVLSWDAPDADSCTGTNFSTGGATSGTITVTPGSTITYTVTCTEGAETYDGSATVTVKAKPTVQEN